MSRRTASNDRYTMAFGVDHTPMGCFFQIWEKVAEGEHPEQDEMDAPQIEGDELFGIRAHNPNTMTRNRALGATIEGLAKTTLRNEKTIIALGKSLGLSIEKDVHELWD